MGDRLRSPGPPRVTPLPMESNGSLSRIEVRLMTSDMWANAGLAEQLYTVLRQCGKVTIRLADLGRHAGLTNFRTDEIAVDHRLDFPAFRGTLVHELIHLRRGPVPEHLAAAEEVAVRHETADVLLPALRYLSRHRDTALGWTDADTHLAALRAKVDCGVVLDAISPPTMPMPAVPLTLVAPVDEPVA